MRKLIVILTLSVFMSGFAQLRMNNSGRVSIGALNVGANLAEAVRDTTITLTLLGDQGDFGEGASIAFGDNESLYTQNVKIGEAGSIDSDILWLHGKHGFTFTHNGVASDTIIAFDDQAGGYVKFGAPIQTSSVYLASDEEFKTDIEPLGATAAMLTRLNPMQYRLMPISGPKAYECIGGVSEKEMRDEEFYTQYYSYRTQGEIKFGLQAQELEEVFPELVLTSVDGKKYVDYIGLIPVLINAVQELSAEVEELRTENENQPMRMVSAASSDSMTDLVTSPGLYQNVPNPFNSSTIIKYRLTDGCVGAQLCVFNLQGTMLRSYPLNTQEKESQLTIGASEFPAGMYLYALICDGMEIDVKRMVVTE